MSKWSDPPFSFEIIRTDTYELAGYWFLGKYGWVWLSADGIANHKQKPFIVDNRGRSVEIEYRPFTGVKDCEGNRIFYKNLITISKDQAFPATVEWSDELSRYVAYGERCQSSENFELSERVIYGKPGITVVGRFAPEKPKRIPRKRYMPDMTRDHSSKKRK